jgi:hypothetical protein
MRLRITVPEQVFEFDLDDEDYEAFKAAEADGMEDYFLDSYLSDVDPEKEWEVYELETPVGIITTSTIGGGLSKPEQNKRFK